MHEADADGAAVLDDQAVDQHVLFQPQVGAVQDRLQKAARRRPAPSALLVDVEVADAFIIAGVEIGNAADAHLFGGVADRVENIPGQPRRLDPPAAAGAVVLALAEKVILEPAERRQHIVIAPAGKAELAPVIVIGSLSAHRDHGVDRRRAADHLAARVGQRAAVEPGFRFGLEHPVGAGIADRKEVADRDVKPDPVVVAAGLQDQDALGWVGRQPVGHDAAGRARADHDIVEITFKPFRHSLLPPVQVLSVLIVRRAWPVQARP